jgi:hypothetical protein
MAVLNRDVRIQELVARSASKFVLHRDIVTAMPYTDNELKKAYHAFKKKLKMQQLEDDSVLGRSPLTGTRSTVVAIQPPLGFGKEIWQELADKEYLKADGGGFYAIGTKQW